MSETIVSEYKVLLVKKTAIEAELPLLAKGYISKKTIKGKTYCYLQEKADGKLTSKYLKAEEVQMISEQLARRKECEATLPTLNARMSELEQAARLIGKDMARTLMLLKISSGMDSIDSEQKKRSISFANAMNAVEGVPASEQTKRDLSDWQSGKSDFLTVYCKTLRRYGFAAEV